MNARGLLAHLIPAGATRQDDGSRGQLDRP